MRVSIVPIGNSRGIRIPKAVLEQCGLNKEAEMEVQDNKVIIKPLKKKTREGWSKAFEQMHTKKDDVMLIKDSIGLEMQNWEW